MLVSMSCVTASHAQKPSTPPLSIATPAIEGVLAAFQNSPLVGMSDDHALAQEEDFYVSLISDPRFAKEIGNVVVEFGNASQQKTLDRYVDGEDVSYAELRRVWGDTSYVGWFPTVTALGYVNFYAAVLAPDGDRMLLLKNLGREGRAEVGVLRTHQLDRVLSYAGTQLAIRSSAASLVDQRSSAASFVP
jgi:hypothetical protein